MQVLAQSRTVPQVPYSHVGYLSAAQMARGEEVFSFALSVSLLALALVTGVGMVGAGIGSTKSTKHRRAWLVALAIFAVFFLLTAGGFAAVEVHDMFYGRDYQTDGLKYPAAEPETEPVAPESAGTAVPRNMPKSAPE